MRSLYQHPVYQLRHSAIPLALLWMGVLAATATAEHLGWLPRWLLLLLTAPAALLALGHIHNAYRRLTWAMKTYRKHLPLQMRRMVCLFPKLARFRLETTKVITHFMLAAAAVTLAATMGVYSVVAVAALLIGIVATVVLRILLPPGGVYLASSDPERIRFFGQLSVRTIPAFAALLEVSNLVNPDGGVQDFFLGVGVLNDYRTTNPDEWPTVLRHLIEMTAVVVVDGRDETLGVQYEVERILRNRLEFKTTFLSSNGTVPAVLSRLNAKSTHPSGTFQVMNPETALQVIPHLVEEAWRFWIPVRMDP